MPASSAHSPPSCDMTQAQPPPARPLQIVFLGPFGLRPKGTMLRRALPMARALAGRGHRVTLLLPAWHTPDEPPRRWQDPTPGVHLETIDLRGLALPLVGPLLGPLLISLRMARRSLALQPDLVHAFKPKAYSHLAALLLRWRRPRPLFDRPPIVIDTDDWEGPGGWNDLEPYSRLQRRFFAWQERAGLARHADAVTVASRALQTLAWSLGIPPAHVAYLPNALDDAKSLSSSSADIPPAPDAPPVPVPSALSTPSSPSTSTSSSPSPSSPFTILLYTRFFEFDLARPLDVLDRLRRDHPSARLLVLGKGLFGEEEQFLQLAEQMGLTDSVDYRGWVEPADLPALLRDADVAIYPFDDTLVNRTKSAFKLLELMNAGLPVVAEAVGQNAEVIQDGRSGRLIPPGDVPAFTAALSELAADPDLRAQLGQGACQRIHDQFSWSRQVASLETLYRGCLERDRTTRASSRGASKPLP